MKKYLALTIISLVLLTLCFSSVWSRVISEPNINFEQTNQSDKEDSKNILSHPLFLLFVGAIISGIFIPWFARRWQYKQKELELKTEIVSDITESMMKTIMTVSLFKTLPDQEVESMSDKNPQEELYKIYKDWEVRGCMIGTKLHSYFPEKKKGKNLRAKWDEFQKKLSKFYMDNKDINKKKSKKELDKEIRELKLFEDKHKIIKEILGSKIRWKRVKQNKEASKSQIP